MIKDIVKDTKALQQKSEPFEFGKDEYLIEDLLDTAHAHIFEGGCVGLAAVQIGVPKRVIVVMVGHRFYPLINPVIIARSPQTFIATEGCLSLEGTREVKRHQHVKVAFTTQQGIKKIKAFSGFPAQIIQHECDHLNGILI